MKPARLRSLLWLTLFGTALLASPARASGEDDVLPLLRAMSEAVDRTTFRGVLVHVHSRTLDAIEIFHQGGAEGYERLFSLTGEPREVIRTPQGVTCILPRQRAIMVDHSLPETPAGNSGVPIEPERLKSHYRFRLEGEDRVAGLRTLVVAIEPRDEFRYGHRFWVEEGTRFPLRSELFTNAGDLLARLMYASIEFLDRIPREALQPRLTGENFRTYRTEAERHQVREGEGQGAKRHPSIRVRWVPPGFLQQSHRWHGMPMTRTAVEHLLYSDGLASFSIYVEQAGTGSNRRWLEGTAVMGSIHAAGRRLGALHVTVVGEVPVVTVEKVAEAIEPEAEP